MAEISNRTLVIAIQTVASEIRSMRAALVGDDVEPEDYELLERYCRAAEELEQAYETAAKTVLNLPPYADLVAN